MPSLNNSNHTLTYILLRVVGIRELGGVTGWRIRWVFEVEESLHRWVQTVPVQWVLHLHLGGIESIPSGISRGQWYFSFTQRGVNQGAWPGEGFMPRIRTFWGFYRDPRASKTIVMFYQRMPKGRILSARKGRILPSGLIKRTNQIAYIMTAVIFVNM